jgi:hypothetical protein
MRAWRKESGQGEAMGVIYTVLCRDCRVFQDLDKFYACDMPIHDRADALELAKRFEKPGIAFRAALLASFMGEHMNHNCTMFTDASVEGQDFDESQYIEHPSQVWKIPPTPGHL